jgi:DNA-binding GntR family transcriptional regulator
MKVAPIMSVQSTYLAIKNMIASKELIGGERIVYDSLFEKLQVDQKTLKKALKKLQANGLILAVSDEGLVVRNFSYTDVLEIFDCRIALETMAVKQFALHGSQARIDDLRNLLVPFEKGPLSAKVFQKINFHFHDIILANSGNRYVYELFEKGNLWLCMDVIGLKRPLKEILQEHLDMVSAIHNRDAARAALLIRYHLENSKQAFLS